MNNGYRMFCNKFCAKIESKDLASVTKLAADLLKTVMRDEKVHDYLAKQRIVW